MLLQENILKILSPIRMADEKTQTDPDFWVRSYRTEAGRDLPNYALVYFLFEDLLKFRNLGREDKTAWTFPIDFNGRLFLLSYRKAGLGIFALNKEKDEHDAKIIAARIRTAVTIASSFFEDIASRAVNASNFNIVNKCKELFERYQYFLNLYQKVSKKLKTRDGRIHIRRYQEMQWVALAVIESFFSWTEHLFIHFAVIAGGEHDGQAISRLIKGEWKEKFKKAIPLANRDIEEYYKQLVSVKDQIRNYVTHGAFGKDGRAFNFHSKTGAVPVNITTKNNQTQYSISGTTNFDDKKVIKLIDTFIQHLWSSNLKPAMEYTQNSQLPTILTLSRNGQYAKAMKSLKLMHELIMVLDHEFDQAVDMDF